MEKIVILTGAGISAESGLGTFRDEDGLWAQHAIEDVATPEGFARDPARVHRFYNARRAQAARARPNAAHAALARLQAEHPGEVAIITQNVDGLHEAAGAHDVIHMHGRLSGALCATCGHRWPAPVEMAPDDPCPACGARATRPDVVWFGEIPHGLDAIWDHLAEAGIFAAIGTSGQVYPAAAFAEEAAQAGAQTVELNLEPSANAYRFTQARHGPASQVVPAWVEEILARDAQ
ncbi:NAD-dependent deacylase [Roseovarius salinarum]|uniref:NAD-dependent deacylase n=1 Tax=Roseovarius salinarum TaxID=1981892 RepID=UPI000C34D338|nr:NAD-dependent deacylase [Roseovarius salinarum]